VRKHRLWEYFLLEKLQFNWDEVHEVAEELEHIQSDKLVERLDSFLGHPKFDPHGDPIPDGKGRIAQPKLVNLTELEPSAKGKVATVLEQNPSFLQHLDMLRIKLHAPIKVLEKFYYDKSMKLQVDKHPVQISFDIAKNILIAV
jgi:DtxR family Mn-dependent transcriptional regulator